MVQLSLRLAATLAVSSVAAVHAFTPTFGEPKQCTPFSFSWSSSTIDSVISGAKQAATYSISFVPLDRRPTSLAGSAPAPAPYTVDVPCHPSGQDTEVQSWTVPSLPFRSGTQFFAEVHVPGVKGVISRRRISDIFTVASHPTGDSSCISAPVPAIPSVPRKWFGKRQVEAATPSFIDVNAPVTTSGVTPPIKEIGNSFIPIDQANAPPTPENAVTPPPASGAPFREIGFTKIPLDGSAPPTVEPIAAPVTDPNTDPALNPETEVPTEEPTEEPIEEEPLEEVTDPLSPETPEEIVPEQPTDGSYQDCVDSCSERWQLYPSAPTYSEHDYVYEDGKEEVVNDSINWDDSYYQDTPSYTPEELVQEEEQHNPSEQYADPDTWLNDYYGTGEWVEVDKNGADSYRDESTAVEYGTWDEMVQHANYRYKAWSPNTHKPVHQEKEVELVETPESDYVYEQPSEAEYTESPYPEEALSETDESAEYSYY